LKHRRGRVSLMRSIFRRAGWLTLGFIASAGLAHAAEHITLANGFDLTCDHRQTVGDRVRLYLEADDSNFVEVSAAEIAASEHIDLPAAKAAEPAASSATAARLTEPELHELLARAGAAHDLDVDLLASVVRQESGGNTRAVSRTGAQGLMQLMPRTAADLGVADAFAPGQNVNGGTAYLDEMLKRYHDNLSLALAAYNAGPGAVDRWHGVPPYRETRAYVARVIHEFNRRIAARKKLQAGNAITQVASAVR
jgi:soluble lytic murein transglycosylase-like protein